MTFTTAWMTHRGGRSTNQDAAAHHVDDAALSVWVVCDGVGGHRGGDVAATLVAEAIAASAKGAAELSAQALNDAFAAAQAAILAREQEGEASGMRTTAVVAMSDGTHLMFGHLGDSRGYLIRDAAVRHLTQDHSVVMALLAGGLIAASDLRSHPDRNKITKALGKGEEVVPTLTPEPIALEPGDAILLCSDGVWEHITDPEIVVDLCKSDSPEAWVRGLFERVMVRAKADHDNLTAIAVFVS
jgi:serine/threonine protein phosphatase PrpC